jgi:hypothetical protein
MGLLLNSRGLATLTPLGNGQLSDGDASKCCGCAASGSGSGSGGPGSSGGACAFPPTTPIDLTATISVPTGATPGGNTMLGTSVTISFFLRMEDQLSSLIAANPTASIRFATFQSGAGWLYIAVDNDNDPSAPDGVGENPPGIRFVQIWCPIPDNPDASVWQAAANWYPTNPENTFVYGAMSEMQLEKDIGTSDPRGSYSALGEGSDSALPEFNSPNFPTLTIS